MCNTLLNKYPDEQIRELLADPLIIRIVKVVGKASLSILELSEYDITRKEVSHALANSIIGFERTTEKEPTDEHGAVPSGDYYYKFLSTKVKLTDLGLFLLERIKDK